MNDIRDIVTFMVQYCKEKNYELDTVKLQALLYYIQWVSLKYENSPCFDEDPIASSVGPVFPTIFKKYETYTSSDYAHERSANYTLEDNTKKIVMLVCDKRASKRTWTIINGITKTPIWRKYYSPYERNTITKKAILETFGKQSRQQYGKTMSY